MQTTVTKTAGGNGFNVMDASRQWMTRPADQRFSTLEDLADAVTARRNRSFQRDYDLNRLRMVQTGEDDLQLTADGRPLQFSNWSFGQLCSTVRSPAAFIRQLPAPLAVDVLNDRLQATRFDQTKRDDNRLLMLRPTPAAINALPFGAPDPAETLQAVTSTGYGRIWDADVVRLAQEITAEHPKFHNPLAYSHGGAPKPSGLYASDRDCFVFLIDGGSALEAGRDVYGNTDVLHRGFFLWNSETGSATFGLQTFLFRFVCGNHIIWSAQDITRLTIRHSKGGPGRFQDEAFPAILNHVNRSAADDVAVIMKAKETLLPHDESDLVDFAARFKLTRAELRCGIIYAKREEGDARTVWQLVQGLTASARDLAFVDARIDLERRASAILKTIDATPAETVALN